MDEPDVGAIVYALARYLRANPRARDTAEGIRRWWLPPNMECALDAVMLALHWMEQHDLLGMTTAADGRQRYSRRGSDEQFDAALRSSTGDWPCLDEGA